MIYLNERAFVALRRPEAVEMSFDKGLRMIGLKKTDPDEPSAFPVKPKSGTRGYTISASAFCTHFLIKAMRTGLFNHVEIDNEGLMSLPLESLSAVTRGAR